VGAGLAAKLKGSDDIAVTYFGDGAVEEGAVQESLNLAKVLGAHVLFVAENNFFSSHMHISLRQPSNAIARFAVAHCLPHEIVDGNDVVAVTRAAERLVEPIRRGEGPAFLEAVTFRWLGHVDWREDVDVGVSRSADEVTRWRGRDPIARLERSLEAAGCWSAAHREQAIAERQEQIADAWQLAIADPWPEASELLGRVHARAGTR
jgi:pyruvate dehydrogenase E1 component alpha subunit